MKRFMSKGPVVYADELLRIPVLRAAEMSPDQLAAAASHVPPVTPSLLLRTLAIEFPGTAPPMATDFSNYFDPLDYHEQQTARQMMQETLAGRIRRRDAGAGDGGMAAAAKWAEEWATREVQLLEEEMNGGDVQRWSGEQYLYGEWQERLTEQQMAMTRDAFTELAATPKIHPQVKREILGHICAIISKTDSK